jgi:hypothetical protein
MISNEQFRERIVFRDAATFFQYIHLHTETRDGTAESTIWDYKWGIDRNENEADIKIAKDICAFANTFGGTLLLGVVEKMNSKNEKTAQSIKNQDQIEAIKIFINDNVLRLINPHIELDIFPINIDGHGTIIAVNVPPILSTIASVDTSPGADHRFSFPYRTSYGNKFFSAEAIKDVMSKNTRQTKYLLKKYSSLHNWIDITTPVFWKPNDLNLNMTVIRPQTRLNGFKEDYCEIIVEGKGMNLPYEFIDTIWSTAEDKIGLFLNVFIVIPEDKNGYPRIIPSQTVNGKFLV